MALLSQLSDLTVVVGPPGDTKRFPVIASTMRLASKVWDAMLKPDGGFLERGAIEVVFPDDDPSVFGLAINIAHAQFEALPIKLTFDELFHLAVLCDKYDLRPLLAIFADKWKGAMSEPGNPKARLERVLLISWVFGYRLIFEKVRKQLILHTYQTEKGSDLHLRGRIVEQEFVPQAVLTDIKAARLAKLAHLSTLCARMLRDFDVDSHTCFVRNGSDKFRCASIIMGSMLLSEKKMNQQTDFVNAETMTQSVQQLKTEFALQLDIETLSQGHQQCFDYYSFTSTVYGQIDCRLPASQVAHFNQIETQASGATTI